ncbi:MAG: membrane protein insertase YidC [marine bacterium B5-7]|nr:MAG: membrane protein insertase YidC [marine bacterium B5-7]
METKRLALYAALVFVGFTLWNHWQQSHAPQQIAPTQTVLTHQMKQTAHTAAAHAPTQFANTKTADSKTVSTTPAEKHDIIHVKTDVLDVTIDRIGGNIVRANLLKYPKKLHGTQAFSLLNNQAHKRYIAQTGIIDKKGAEERVFSSAKTSYQLAPNAKSLSVDLTWQNPNGLAVVKRYTFTRDRYVVNVDYQLANRSSAAWQGQLYSQLSREWPIPTAKKKGFMQSMATFTGAALSTAEKPYKKRSFKALAKEDVNTVSKGGWVAMIEQYFVSAWIPNAKQDNHFYSQVNDNLYTVGALTPTVKLAAGAKASEGFKLYVGPEINERLKAAAPHLNLTIDFGWLWFISMAILWLLNKVHWFLGNWGWSIVIVTFLIKLMFYKLSATSYRSMANMRKIQPKLDILKKRYGDDKQRFSKEMMGLYKKEKVNPLGGCLPMIAQIPVFIALYWVLLYSVQFRQAPFMLWIHDLAAPDPYYILPLLMGASMLLQTKLSPQSPDPAQAKVMMLMPVIFTFFFLHFPAGLVLYWTVNNILSILQQWYIMRQVDKQRK